MAQIETDYLVIGAGAAGMAFADSLVSESDADVVLVDRRHRPGGHWRDAYSFVRLHQPSPFYGVNSRRLGNDSIDRVGPNAGLYERATGPEIVGYFDRVLDEQFLPSGRVRFFGLSDYVGGDGDRHHFVAYLSDVTTEVRVRRKVVDATYLEARVPSTAAPAYGVDPDVDLIPVNGLVDLREPAGGYTVIGAGKTAMDACSWLLDNEVPAEVIRWIRPWDAWLLDRALTQPLDLVSHLIDGTARSLEAAATAENVGDLFARLDDNGFLLRLDEAVEPEMYRCATVSQPELDSLRRIDDVVRMGRVRHIGTGSIELERGEIPTRAGDVHVDCTGDGLRARPPLPIFDADRIVLQQVRTCQPTFNAALIGFIECRDLDDAERNRLCPPNPYPSAASDFVAALRVSTAAEIAWLADRDVASWLDRSRLNVARGARDHMGDPVMQSAMGRFIANAEPAVANLTRLGAPTA